MDVVRSLDELDRWTTVHRAEPKSEKIVRPENRQGGIASEREDGFAIVKDRAERTMARVDRQPRVIRELAHEYGWMAVNVLISQGITRARVIEHVITTIRDRRGDCPVCRRMTAEGIELLQAQRVE